MGVINNKFNFKREDLTFFKASWARLDREKCELIIDKNPIPCNYQENLKDIQYVIIDGILYIKGKKYEWSFRSDEGFGGKKWYENDCFEINEVFLEKHIIPENCLIRNKKRLFKKIPLVINHKKNPNGRWFRKKQEIPFSYCMHPFKLKE